MHLRDAYYLLVDSLTKKYRYVTQQVTGHNTYKFKTTQNGIQEERERERESKSSKFGVYWETPKKSLFVAV
jgi:hypothetical protein